MFRKVVTGSVLVMGVLVTSSANAADLAPPVIQDQWAGFYVGAHAGVMDSRTTIRDESGTIFDSDGGTLFTNDLTGLGGLHGGYNWQLGAGVFGIELDYSWTDAGRDRVFDGIDHIANTDIDGFGSVRGRAGLAVDNALIYVTGGVGFVDAFVLGQDNFPDQVVQVDDFVAFVAGAGAEFKLSADLSARLEFLHYFFSEESDLCNDCGDDEQIFGGGLNVLRAGVSYHFGQPADQVPEQLAGNLWTGAYIGGHVGAVDTSTGVHDEPNDVTSNEGNTIVTNGLDFAGGIHAGYNYAIRSAVLGIEADYTFTDSGFSRSMSGGDSFLSSQIDGIGSIRARLGLATGNAHAYVTGGIAFINSDIVAQDDAAAPEDIVSYNGFTALVAGAGVEALVAPQVSVRGEYLHYSFDEKGEVCGSCDGEAVLADGEIQMLRVGASYHFNGSAGEADYAEAGDWSGFYVGAHASFIDASIGVRDESVLMFDSNDEGSTSFRTSQSAGGGLFGGYNVQWGNAVVGLEVDYTFTDAGENRIFDDVERFNFTDVDGFGSVRGRLGLAAGDALFYATGGIGWIDAGIEAGIVGNTDRQVQYDDFIAIVAGFGTEYRVGESISLRGEYLYFGFDEKSELCNDCAPDAAYADGELHVFRGGISYHLN